MARTVRIRVPEAHSDPQRQLLEAFITPHLREFWGCCGTKFGKSFGGAGAFAVAVPLRPQALWRWIGPIYSQSMIGFNYIRRMLPAPPHTEHLVRELGQDIIEPKKADATINLPTLDSRIQFFHGQKPESLEGEGTAGNLIDEAAKQKEEVYHAAKTTTTFTRGLVGGFSTPKGKNWFYKRCMAAKEEMERAAFEKRPPRMIFIHAPSYANPGVLPETIEEMRKTMTDRLFRQYVQAEFLDDGSVFAFLSDAFGRVIDFSREDVWYASTHESKSIYVGADWAKQVDYSVFTALNEQGRLVGYKRFNKVAYPEQVGALFAFCQEVKSRSVLIGCHVVAEHDKTGVGEAIDDIIRGADHGIDIVGIRWTNQLKETYVNDLVLSFEERAISLPPWETLRFELESFELTTSPTGRVVYGAPEGMHDDTVMSLVLANKLFRQGRGSISSVAVVDYLQNLVHRIHYGGPLDLD